jgi:hypothetical protein
MFSISTFVIFHFNTIITAFVTGTWLARQLPTLSCSCADHCQLSPFLSFIKWGWFLSHSVTLVYEYRFVVLLFWHFISYRNQTALFIENGLLCVWWFHLSHWITALRLLYLLSLHSLRRSDNSNIQGAYNTDVFMADVSRNKLGWHSGYTVHV